MSKSRWKTKVVDKEVPINIMMIMRIQGGYILKWSNEWSKINLTSELLYLHFNLVYTHRQCRTTCQVYFAITKWMMDECLLDKNRKGSSEHSVNQKLARAQIKKETYFLISWGNHLKWCSTLSSIIYYLFDLSNSFQTWTIRSELLFMSSSILFSTNEPLYKGCVI